MMSGLHAVLFDGWHTVFHNQRQPGPLGEFNAILNRSFSDYAYLCQFEHYFSLDATGDLPQVLERFLCAIGQSATPEQRSRLTNALEAAAADVAWYDEALENLGTLRKSYRLGLISNTGIQGATALRRTLGLDSIFEACTFSYEIGALKPDPAVFQAALHKMNVTSESAVFVGDHPTSDYRGATDVGMQAILIDRKGRHADEGMRIIRSLSELSAAIDRL